MEQLSFRALKRLFAVIALLLPPMLLADERGESVGSVLNARGATAHNESGAIRFLGKGDRIYKGDVISTAARSFAVVSMADKTKLTVRPGSVLRVNEFNVKPKKENVLISLFRGGLRAITGFVSKRRSNAFRLRTGVATIGIRGTEFDARLCEEDDCSAEASKLKRNKRLERKSEVIGRVVARRGSTFRETAESKKLPISSGAPVVVGDVLTTGKNSFMVVVYRDRSRMTLLENTRFKIEALASSGTTAGGDGASAGSSAKKQAGKTATAPAKRSTAQAEQPAKKENAVFRLFRGGLRVITGLIGRRNPSGFRIRTGVATIGIRGTAFDAVCPGGDCAGPQGVYVRTREGTAMLNDNPVPTGRIGRFAQGNFQFVNQLPLQLDLAPPGSIKTDEKRLEQLDSPAPESIDVDEQPLFQQSDIGGTPQGLYLACRSGHCSVDDVDLGPGEALYKGTDAPAQRLVEIPQFLTADPYLNSEQLLVAPPATGSPVTAPETCAVP